MRVKIIEDNEHMAKLLLETLTQAGMFVTICTDSERACEPERWEGVDAAVVDLLLPKVSGTVIARYLKDHFPDIRVIILTGMPMDPAEELALLGFAHRVMRKESVSVPALVAALTE